MRDQTKLKVDNVLDFVNEHIEANGYPPSVREICAALGHKSTSTVHIYLKELEREGKIVKSPSKPRALRVMRGVGETVRGGAGKPSGRQAVVEDKKISQTAGTLSLVHPASTPERKQRAPTGATQRTPAREDTVYVPVIGRVTAGKPIFATENIEYTFPVPSFFVNNASVFMLKVEGDSMINAGIQDRDYILVRRQQTAQNGEIVVALIDDEATVKTFYKERNRIRLQPENERYSPLYAYNNCIVVGKVIGIFRKL